MRLPIRIHLHEDLFGLLQTFDWAFYHVGHLFVLVVRVTRVRELLVVAEPLDFCLVHYPKQ